MSDAFDNCTSVTPQCPVEATTYGYTPNLAGNVILLAVFAACNIAQVFFCGWYRLWSFGICVSIGCLLEWVGYIGRVMMHNNPWDDVGFKIQIVCLIIAPSFLAAGIYLTLKHIIMALGPGYSRLQPKWYTWIFISCDALSIVIQAVGGGIAASSDGSAADTGANIMVAGIAIQVATMAVCVLLAIDFAWAVFRSTKSSGASSDGVSFEKAHEYYSTTKGFYYYLICTSFAFLFIFIRCIYRLPEMAGGWGNPLMQNEKEFLILDGAMIALACILMSIAHPGMFFPDMRTKK
ncbi:hypothetical protein PRZ48_007709 [Zasmidium cellare]|uniref:Uncharacterized protein n=1 Tax=Zasmidium cellare TaxID=395010 RepID=A0ABR0EL59_ZASCE|nr:hypothetical protein PRZ48_007709 [Zasmidium cellare]